MVPAQAKTLVYNMYHENTTATEKLAVKSEVLSLASKSDKFLDTFT